jgi:O-succinylbenzoic acid--CoA ligase
VTVALEVGPGDSWLCCLPVHHVAGLAIVARSWALGTPMEVLPGFDVDAVARSDASLVSLVPVMARRLVGAGVDLNSAFRRVLLGGGPIPADLPGVRGYGLTETWGGVVYDGVPLAGVDVRLGDDDEILVHGSMVMKGYRLAPQETDAAFVEHRFLRTGDAGAFDADGRLRVIDRLRDLVITGGVNVSPTEVEAALVGHPAVADVAVTGRSDPEWGERVVAYVVPADPSTPPRLDDLRDFARDRLSPAKLPRELVLVDSVPRTGGGKPLRRLLRDTSTARP